MGRDLSKAVDRQKATFHWSGQASVAGPCLPGSNPRGTREGAVSRSGLKRAGATQLKGARGPRRASPRADGHHPLLAIAP